MRTLNKIGLIDLGFPILWLVNGHSYCCFKSCHTNEYSFNFYSEDGEVEYGGDKILESWNL